MRKPIIQRGLLGGAIASVLLPSLLASPSLALSMSSQINAALNYPNASERFFNQGRQQFEQEIHRLTQEPSETASEPLQIDENLPAKLEQQRLQLEQPNGRSPDSNSPSSPDAL
jgi:hypothetical protein